jgi:hypothetical protein
VLGQGLCFLGHCTFDALTFGALLDSVGLAGDSEEAGAGLSRGVKSPRTRRWRELCRDSQVQLLFLKKKIQLQVYETTARVPDA